MYDIALDVGPSEPSGKRIVIARFPVGEYRDRIDTASASGRRKLFEALAKKLNCETEELSTRYDEKLCEAADAADREVERAAQETRPDSDNSRVQSKCLVELAQSAALWHTPDDDAYATVEVEGHLEHWKLRSKGFRQWLAHRCFVTIGRAPSLQAIGDAITILEGEARFTGISDDVHLRLAEHEGSIHLDLVDAQRRAIEINPRGWQIIDRPQIKFRRTRAMQPLPLPVRGGQIDELRDFINCDDASWQMIVAWLLAALRPRGPYPILALFAEQGSGKSTTARLLRSLVDPNAASLRSEPQDQRDLVIAANNAWLIALDNLSHIPSWLSDALCRLSTGGGYGTRTLYENDEETVFNAQRPILLTAIDDVAGRGDLLDRSLIVRLPSISEDGRCPEDELLASFERARPRILGALLDAVVIGLQNLPNTRPERLPRMADFARWVTACEPALGWIPGSFISAYSQNRDDANSLALDASPIVPYVMQLADNYDRWEGTATELLVSLEQLAGYGSGPGLQRPPKGWPANAKSLSGMLKRLAPNLRQVGNDLESWREAGGIRRRMLSVKRSRNHASRASRASQMPPTCPISAEPRPSNGPATINGIPSRDARDGRDATLHIRSAADISHGSERCQLCSTGDLAPRENDEP